MRDPRLAEIEFLMELERDAQMTLSAAEVDEHGHPLDASTARWFGLGLVRFRDMVLDLLLRGFIDSINLHEFDEYDSYLKSSEHHRANSASALVRRRPITVHLNHAGRIHLWNQRDALLRDPDLEPFGLRSRAAWDRDLFLRLQWSTPQAPLSLLFLDLDNFGRVNKEHGHPVGDAVLRLVFGLVSSVVGTRGAAYRYGGEEVGVLFPNVDRATAAGIAEELRALIERDVHVQVSQLDAPQTATIGVAELTGPMANDAAVTRAEEPVRRTKLAHKKNRVVLEEGAATDAAPGALMDTSTEHAP